MAVSNGPNGVPVAHPDSGNVDRTAADQARFRLAAIVEASDDAIVGKDLNGIVTAWNSAAAAIFGYASDEIIGQSITRIIPPARIDEETEILDRVRRGEKVDHFETERQRKDGRVIPVSIAISPIRDDRGAVIGVSQIARDLRAPQRFHLELRRREALLRSVLDTIAEALVVIDDRGLIRSFSVAAERLFGFAAGEVIGRDVSVLMPAPYQQDHDGFLARYAATGERHVIDTGRIVVGRRKDGTTFPMELAVGEADLPEERLFPGVITDLTERQEPERRLTELQAEFIRVSRLNDLGQMVSVLSHEVNQPLTAITNYVGGARRLLAAGDQRGVEQALERIAEQARRAREIIQRLRGLARIGDSARQAEDLRKTIEEASALALFGVGSGPRLTIRIDNDAAWAVIDRIQIQQVLINLIRNAVEAMVDSERRELTIGTARMGELVEISVTDTGPGLPETLRDRLFEPFLTTKPGGTGVGLSVCRAIVEAHGGELRIEYGDGGGTVCLLTVPVVEGAFVPEVSQAVDGD